MSQCCDVHVSAILRIFTYMTDCSVQGALYQYNACIPSQPTEQCTCAHGHIQHTAVSSLTEGWETPLGSAHCHAGMH